MQASITPTIKLRFKQVADDISILPEELDLLQALFAEFCDALADETSSQDEVQIKQALETLEPLVAPKAVAHKQAATKRIARQTPL